MIAVAIAGVAGRMGRAIAQAVLEESQTTLVAASTRSTDPALGSPLCEITGGEEIGLQMVDSLHKDIEKIDVVIDFTTAASSVDHTELCHRHGKAIVIGTTGLQAQHREAIVQFSQDIPVVLSANMSVGANVMFMLLKMAGEAIGATCDVEIIEAHHRHKVDAPSGTALQMGEIIAGTQGQTLRQCALYGARERSGPRPTNAIGFSSLRAGSITGEHSALFIGADERVEIGVRTENRQAYAKGAVRAAMWLKDRPAGLFDMQDVLGFKDSGNVLHK